MDSTFGVVVLAALLLAYGIASIIELRLWLHWRDFERHATREEKDERGVWVMMGRDTRLLLADWREASGRDSAMVTLWTLFDAIRSDRIGRIPALASIFMLCLAAYGGWSYAFYVLLRIVVSLSSAYLALKAHAFNKNFWTWIMVGVCILFNPLIPLRLHRSDWQPLDLFAAGTLAIGTKAFSRYAATQ